MYLDSDVKQLLKDYRNDINDKNFKKIYDEAVEFEGDANIIGEFTQTLLLAKIDPVFLDANLKHIPNNYLQGTSEIEFIFIPKKISYIGKDAFSYSSLKNVYFEDGAHLEHIYDGAFENCFYLKSIKIPNKVKSLGAHCFAGCDNLDYIYLPKSIVSIGEHCFYDTYMESIEYEGTMKNFETILEKFFDEDTKGEIQYIKCVDGVYELK